MSDWIKWEAKEGAVCPFAADTLVDVAFGSQAYYGCTADSWGWGDCVDDINHYRIHDGTNPPAPGSDAELIAELVAVLKRVRDTFEVTTHDDGRIAYISYGEKAIRPMYTAVAAAIHKAESRQ